MRFDQKLHYKMYKDGKRWVFVALSVTFLSGASFVVEDHSTIVRADTTSAVSAVSNSNSSSSSTTSLRNSTTSADSTSSNDKSKATSADMVTQASKASSESDIATTEAGKASSTVSDTQQISENSSSETKHIENSSSVNTSSDESVASSVSQNTLSSTKIVDQTVNQSGITNTEKSLNSIQSLSAQKNSQVEAMSAKTTASTVQTFSGETNQVQAAASSIDTDSYLKNLGIDIENLNANSVLKLASLFHIFANQAKLEADVNGNVAVGVLTSSIDFGTRGDSDNLTNGDIYYIQKLSAALESSSFRNTTFNHVVLGKDVAVSINGNQVSLDGVVMSNLKADDVYQDANGDTYINFTQVFDELSVSSTEYSTHENSSGVIESFSDMNNRYVDVSNATVEGGIIYVNIPFAYLNASQPITIKGVSSSIDGPTIIINVTNIPAGDQSISTQTELDYTDGTSGLTCGESHSEPNHILWNFDNGDETLNFSGGRFMGSILAPNATINAGVNIDGNIVANVVNVTGGESHRWDIHPNQPTQPTQSSQPTQPTQSSQPTQPTQTSQPTQPTQSSQPTQPTQSSQPTQPTQTSQPTQPTQASQPTQPTQASQPTQPTQPTQASQPTQPTQSSQPTQPTQASQPTQPTQASQPTQPTQTSQPTQPTQSSQPTQPTQSSQPTQPTQSSQPTQPTQTSQPTQPTQASQPTQPTQASQPTQPTQTSQPTQPTQASQPTQPTQASQPTQPTQSSQPTQPTQPTQSSQPTQPTQASQPTQPTQASQPTQPTQPTQSSQPTQPTQSSQPTQLSVKSSVGNSTNVVTRKTAVKKELPQTGQANQSSISLIGFVLLALGSIIGWLGFSKKKNF
ncbi:MAG: KxYKxGKxW signal peptide domain-containing protein [Liquorilactobacillus nagelii]|uniref:collagen-binding domain-containing protein n=3 Tax=Liquorilactobacillus nagelii TaxID=82688 RepID=UPI00242E2E23|nr:collagen-binding domain-containing protein [Liquorilactobacillus nagelii]MCI1632717.1 KxYKxGKxW signal peptide domain-containing protein [Liquorilactobacillus nagelii]